MKFQLAINLERIDDSLDMNDVARHTLEMVQMAEEGGFDIVWAAEHHAIEMTIAPNPFQILTWWAGETSNIRLGTAVATAAYWHPINLAGEAAFLDLISGGRLEFGIGSGAYQREFDRMKPGLKQSDAWRYMQEMLPAVRALWQGDYAHDGEYWQFPTSTSVPKPVQADMPVWVAARSPITYDYAVRNRCHINCWPLTRPFAEAELYKKQLDEAIAKADNGWSPRFALMRHACIYDNAADRQQALDAIRRLLSQFENLFRNAGDVVNGFPAALPLDQIAGREQYDPEMLEENLMFGSPETAIAKLKRYEDLGVNEFIYYASMGLDHDAQKRSLRMFCNEVMPEFR
ncbi:LLM class flavin-dependent oxidoreductase [Ruegeria pomeroyi]|uniref:LLM class flavin-dependent oxidoreductase n=2 Tax=Ruegeria TaxID=97050 RepID=A0A9Q3ZNS6_9RHOB|nr:MULTISPECIES: LLM class flavin-dependent oxidoreductase [Ruegeria]MCE8513904.1 LLM class flavin-dependent oxidoreductase [Ruegeria pomeroyi]MCE8516251.1 LLM class flavin-dependent oxidoreductase [Ruegeria pomeroyi]MCE8530441.1 LLM class flavin-dependent oxidoreductase [Ruegeria pomeroyi]MCE8537317.1 LLM class flavin-dependent oxidoreductase [Ruegeria pomeroyi]MCE8547056.1 LLM class flavin-dependent oxidoreductase [Ruegeria pomeroyi]